MVYGFSFGCRSICVRSWRKALFSPLFPELVLLPAKTPSSRESSSSRIPFPMRNFLVAIVIALSGSPYLKLGKTFGN